MYSLCELLSTISSYCAYPFASSWIMQSYTNWYNHGEPCVLIKNIHDNEMSDGDHMDGSCNTPDCIHQTNSFFQCFPAALKPHFTLRMGVVSRSEEHTSELQSLPLRVRDCHTYNPQHNLLWFSSTPTSPYPNP